MARAIGYTPQPEDEGGGIALHLDDGRTVTTDHDTASDHLGVPVDELYNAAAGEYHHLSEEPGAVAGIGGGAPSEEDVIRMAFPHQVQEAPVDRSGGFDPTAFTGVMGGPKPTPTEVARETYQVPSGVKPPPTGKAETLPEVKIEGAAPVPITPTQAVAMEYARRQGGGYNPAHTVPTVAPEVARTKQEIVGLGHMSDVAKNEADMALREGKYDVLSQKAAEMDALQKRQEQADEAYRQFQMQQLKVLSDKMEEARMGRVDMAHFAHDPMTATAMSAAPAIGMATIGSGISGQQNEAVRIINDAANRDLQMQQMELQKHGSEVQDQVNLMGQMRALYGDQNQAFAAAKAAKLAWAQGQIELQATKETDGDKIASLMDIYKKLGAAKVQLMQETTKYVPASSGGGMSFEKYLQLSKQAQELEKGAAEIRKVKGEAGVLESKAAGGSKEQKQQEAVINRIDDAISALRNRETRPGFIQNVAGKHVYETEAHKQTVANLHAGIGALIAARGKEPTARTMQTKGIDATDTTDRNINVLVNELEQTRNQVMKTGVVGGGNSTETEESEK